MKLRLARARDRASWLLRVYDHKSVSGVRGGMIGLLLLGAGCAATPVGPMAPPLPPPTKATSVALDGVVTGPNRWILVAGVRVEIIQGPSTGQSTVTDANGHYRLDVTTGVVQLRWSKPGYVTSESLPLTFEGDTATLDCLMNRAPWHIKGTVTDRNGAPIQGARLSLCVTACFSYSGSADSDSAGRFDLSTSVGAGSGYLRVSRSPFVIQKVSYSCEAPPEDPNAGLCGDQTSVTANVQMVRIVSVNLRAPTVLAVGQGLPIEREVLLDDGRLIVDDGANWTLSDENRTWAYDPAVAVVTNGRVIGMAVGTATLTSEIGFIYAYLPLRVEPPSVAIR